MDDFGRRAEDNGQESTREILMGIRSDLKFYIRNQERHEAEDKDNENKNLEKFKELDARTKGLELREARIYGGAGVVAFVVALLVKMFK